MIEKADDHVSSQSSRSHTGRDTTDRTDSISRYTALDRAPRFETSERDVFDAFATESTRFSSEFSSPTRTTSGGINYCGSFVNQPKDAISSAISKIESSNQESIVSAGVSVNAVAQIGLLYPIIGFGPYLGTSVSFVIDSAGDIQVGAQFSYGGGMGSFMGLGLSPQFSKGYQPTDGWSSQAFAEVNMGLGTSYGIGVYGGSENVSVGLSSKYLQLPGKLAKYGVGFGAAFAVGKQKTYNFTIPTSRILNSVDVDTAFPPN